MMKPLVLSSFLVFQALFSFSQSRPVLVGNDKDAHGCIPSAGYTFSIVKNDCIRVFEQAVQLKQISPKGPSTSIAAVIFNGSNTVAEVFLPESAQGVVLQRMRQGGGYVWKKGELSLSHWKGYVLKRRNKVIFRGA